MLLIIGVVGKMASGKSTVCRYLKAQIEDTEIIDVDRVAKAIYCEKPDIVRELKDRFGDSICFPEGNLNYNKLAYMIFSSHEELKKINEIMFPEIENKIKQVLEEKKDKNCLVIDAAVLFDSKLSRSCDYIIWVKADRERRFKLLSSISNLDEEKINTRLDGQMISIEERLVDFIIDNNGTLQELENSVRKITEEIKSGRPVK